RPLNGKENKLLGSATASDQIVQDIKAKILAAGGIIITPEEWAAFEDYKLAFQNADYSHRNYYGDFTRAVRKRHEPGAKFFEMEVKGDWQGQLVSPDRALIS